MGRGPAGGWVRGGARPSVAGSPAVQPGLHPLWWGCLPSPCPCPSHRNSRNSRNSAPGPPPSRTVLVCQERMRESRSLEPRINVESDSDFPKAKYLSPDCSSAQTRREQKAGRLAAPTEALAAAGGMAGLPCSFPPLQPLSCGQSRPCLRLQGQRLCRGPVSPMPPTTPLQQEHLWFDEHKERRESGAYPQPPLVTNRRDKEVLRSAERASRAQHPSNSASLGPGPLLCSTSKYWGPLSPFLTRQSGTGAAQSPHPPHP